MDQGSWTLLADAFSRSPLGRYLAEEPDHRVLRAPIVYKNCLTCQKAAEGRCPDCHQAAAGAGMTCHRCHKRLPWAYEGARCLRNHRDDPRTTRRGRQEKRLISPERAVDGLPDVTFEEREGDAAQGSGEVPMSLSRRAEPADAVAIGPILKRIRPQTKQQQSRAADTVSRSIVTPAATCRGC